MNLLALLDSSITTVAVVAGLVAGHLLPQSIELPTFFAACFFFVSEDRVIRKSYEDRIRKLVPATICL